MKKLLTGSLIVGTLIFAAVLAPLIHPFDPSAMQLSERLSPPSLLHPLGQDENGADVLSKILYGARISLSVAFIVVSISSMVGLAAGTLAGYNGKLTDNILMRIVDIFVAFPGFLLSLAFVAVLGPSLFNMIFALCLTSWTPFARLVRAEVLHSKEREHVQAARALGAGPLRIAVWHIWPNLVSLLTVQMSFALAATIIAESGLSFLGLGVPPDYPTWGGLLSSGRRMLFEAPYISFAAGLAIMYLVLGFNLLGDGLREVLDPRQNRKTN